MVFGRGRTAYFQFHVGEHRLPRVRTYTYLGVTLHKRLCWAAHVDELLRRGECKMAACLSWTNSAILSLSFVERIFQTYVRPAVCFGLEFVPASTQLRHFQTRFQQWGRRLLMWPRGSPGVAVQGQLGRQDVNTMRFSQATCLFARLLSLPRSCLAARVAKHAASEPNSWLCSTLRELQQLGAPHLRDFGIASGC